MLELIFIALATIFAYLQVRRLQPGVAAPALSARSVSPRLAQLTTYADRLYGEKKWLAAEKAYLNILKLDHKNVTAYQHLGIIYTAQKNLGDAIECFEIAARLHPSGASLQNLGLAFYDNHNYIKAIAAFKKAVMLEATAPRYIALSRAYQKLEQSEASLVALEQAVKLTPNKANLQLLVTAYDTANRRNDALAIRRRIRELDSPKTPTTKAARSMPRTTSPKP